MEQLVEGEWKRYTFKLITKPDYPGIVKHLEENFHQDEPLSIIVGNSELKYKDLERFTIPVLDDGLSIAAFETATGKLAGCRITFRCRKGEKDSFKCESEELGTIFGFLGASEGGVDFFENFGVDEYAELIMASVDREFRGDGLATEMYERTLKLLRAHGFKLTKSAFTSPFTRKISEKYGFEDVSKKYFRELQNTKGEYLCPDSGEENFCAVKVLRL